MRFAGCRLENQSGHDAGRMLLRQLYFEETGLPLPAIHVTGRGNPYFPNSQLFFSITHTRHHAFCVLSHEPVGIDAEELSRRVPHLRLAHRILSSWEQEAFSAAEDKNRAFLTFWVLKEASAKLSGLGLQGFPNHTSFSLSDPRVQEIDGCLVAILSASDPDAPPIYPHKP